MDQNKPKKQPNPFLKYMGLGGQMAATIFLGNYLGKWLDGKYAPGQDVWEKGVTLFAVFVSIYHVIKQVTRESK